MAALTTFAHDPDLDLDPWIGQRKASFKFFITDAVTNERLADIKPIRDTAPKLTHDTTATIKRQLNIQLGTRDTATVDPVSQRLSPYMVFPGGREMPLGKYMFSSAELEQYTSGDLGRYTLTDEMFLVDQQLTKGITGYNTGIPALISMVLDGLPIVFELETAPYISSESWGFGSSRGQVLETLAISGSYFSPWFNNYGIMRFIRAFNASDRICDFDFDSGNKVMRQGIVKGNNVLSAPNTFIVTSNSSSEGNTAPIIGIARVAPTAPNSVEKRGFQIVSQQSLQVTNNAQAAAVAYGLAQRQSTLENVTLITPPDPRHDGYNVIRWNRSNWLELAWDMTLVEGGTMTHRLRKTYGV